MRQWLVLVVALAALSFAACGDDGGDSGGGQENDLVAETAEPGVAWESVGAPALGGFMKLESYGCREDAVFVAISGGQQNNIYKLDLGDVDAGWKNLNDQSAQLEPVKDHVILAFPEGKT